MSAQAGIRSRRLAVGRTTRVGFMARALAAWLVWLLPAAAAFAEAPPYTVAPGDVLEIAIFAGGERQEDASETVAPDGSIQCPFVGTVAVAGMSVAELTSTLQQRLARDYYQDPTVVVSVRQYGAMVSVSGEVRRPGVYRLLEARTALGACALAGGLTDFASPRAVRVMRLRAGKTVVLRVDLTSVRKGRLEDFVLEPGDRIEVPRRLL